MGIQDFFIKHNGQFLDTDGFPKDTPYQCVDVIKAYFKEVLGIEPVHGDAINYFNNPPKGFTKIKKAFFNQPQPGDILVLSPNHISICNWSRPFDWGGFEQNYPIGAPCHFQDHPNYKNVLGWLRYNPVKKDKLVMDYICYNADPAQMEEARKLLVQYSGGKVDATFTYVSDQRLNEGIFTVDEQVKFMNEAKIAHPFGIFFYDANMRHIQMTTAQVPGFNPIMTFATPYTQPIPYLVYEFCNALNVFFKVPVQDIFTPDEAFIKMRFNTILPYVDKHLLS